MATVFDIDFTSAPDGALNSHVPAGMQWSDASGFSIADPFISGGRLVCTADKYVRLNKTVGGDPYGDVLSSWYVNGGYSAVPGHIDIQFTLVVDSFLSFGCVYDDPYPGSPVFSFYVPPSGVAKVQCKLHYVEPIVTVGSGSLLIGGAINTARVSWNEYSVTFTLNGSVVYYRASSSRPGMHPFIRGSGSAKVSRISAGDTKPEPPAAPPVYWTNKINVTETP